MDTKKEITENEVEPVIPTTPSDVETKPEKRMGGFTKFLIFLMLVLSIIAGGLAANGQLLPLIESVKARLETAEPVETTDTVPEVDDTIATEPLYLPEQVLPSSDASEPLVDTQESIESEEQLSLQDTILQLRSELQEMETSQQNLRDSIREQQQQNLKARLHWITDPSSTLVQIQRAWKEISMLPSLNEEQRASAQAMHTLAQTSIQKLGNWKDAITRWTEELSTPIHEDVIPKPDHPWLAWITSQFHLRQAPSEEARKLNSLRNQLNKVSHQLNRESWPTDAAWQGLYAELLLHVKSMQSESGSAVELGLPDTFSILERDIVTLRQTAQLWSQNSRGEF